jgi:molybdopterin molybdotransferase
MDAPITMISVEEALAYILGHFHVLEPERVSLLDAIDLVLAEDVRSDMDIPPFDNSGMDGYAVRSADTAGAGPDSPVTLRVIADLAAGYTTTVTVTPGTAIRIMTGAPLPAGADSTVQFEDTDEQPAPGKKGKGAKIGKEQVKIFRPSTPGLNIRPRSEDVKKGELVIAKGTAIRPSELGVLASLGYKDVLVIRRPRVAVLATGDELVEVDQPIGPGQIRNSNTYSVASLVLHYGGIPLVLGIARDTVESLTSKLDQAAGADMIITSAGVSAGDYDVVKEVLKSQGEMHFWRVRMQPGKPLAFGRIRNVPLLGLPGNPVSAMVSFEQFGRPSILKMLGRSKFAKPTIEVTLVEDVHNKSGRRHFMRSIVEKRGDTFYARVTGEQGSGILTSMVKANALIIVPEGTSFVPAGTRLPAQMLDWPEELADFLQ